ncbi:amidohydrolase [Ruminococcus sp. 210702-SL.1.03]|uniref:amidohydrolase n=1 Tax=Ruminococcus sp. 210702-SL.1.03 TaxID=2883233 RepID=UPI001D093518|nr:amidohydrolase [Ruminococcus sp. 210702-SL.1.03]MCB6615154.1 amidohydrolase [Ruminococcus sp. 210702-SL.1.03]
MKIYNVKIFTMNKARSVIEKGWVEITEGKITAVCEGTPSSFEDVDIDGGGAALYPGFIDAHTHVGLTTNGVGIESEDFNEESEPCSAQLRVIDAINPFDESFEKARNAGITSVLISPGSMNPVAGDIVAVSTDGRRIDNMLLRRVGIKFALGENPKMTYMNRDETPCTRMAIAAMIREALLKAQRYMADKEAAESESDLPELDPKSEALIPLLRGELKAHFHCHRADDIFTALRISREFGLDYVLIHCTDGHLIAGELALENASAVVGPIICDPCKPELANITPKNAGLLAQHGVKTAICTDHSETPIEYLPLTVGIAVKNGMTFMQALEAVTINAAEIGGIDDLAGSIETGKRADMVMFEGSPFEVMSEPKLVMINGTLIKYRKEIRY